jgi:hypothetical protein
MYNQFALNLLAPSGWRCLTAEDTLYFWNCNPYKPKSNLYAANTGHWNLSYWTDTSNAGETGINFQGYGQAYFDSLGNMLWDNQGLTEIIGYSPVVPPNNAAMVNLAFGYVGWGNLQSSTYRLPMYARFIKL